MAAISRALRDYTGCTCDDCLIPYLYQAVQPFIPDYGEAVG